MAEPIAIVGMACRFGGAPNLNAFWDLLTAGREGISEYPGGHSAEIDRFYEAAGSELGPPSSRGGFLEEIDRFDASFFGIAPREAELMDPQQRILLELTWEAMQDAAETPQRLAGAQTGVFVGVWSNGYERVIEAREPVADLFSTSGNSLFGISGRLAFAFDLQGPELSVNSGCASSLSAVHQARAALLAGECDVAIAAGVNVLLRPDITQGFARAGMLSADSHCKFGSVDADGFVRSEGAGVVILKRLSRAQASGDRIYAVIRGSALSNSGNSSGSLSRPSDSAQASVVKRAIADAGLGPGDIDYVEAHGTGTFTGDPIELSALSSVFADGERSAPVPVGSVKTNIGHSESAAGIAGLIKTTLALHHGYLPASLNVSTPHPDVDWANASVSLHTQGGPWRKDGPRRAGVSSFGLAGANTHTIVEEAPAAETRPAPAHDALLLPLSARSGESLRALATAYADRLDGAPDAADVCYTAARGRSAEPFRFGAIGTGAAELSRALREFATSDAPEAADASAPRAPVFVFSGQGSQWTGMGRRLFALEPAFRASIEASDASIAREAGWSLIEQLHDDAAGELGIDRVQPMLFAMQVALAALWRSYGQAPAVCLGHSMGEVAAAHVAGALSLEDAVAVICRRSALMLRFKGQGAMALVDLTMSDAAAAIAGREDELSIAVSSGPHSTVLSGEPRAVDAVVAKLEADGVFCRRIAVDVAAHSPQMGLIAGELGEALRGLRPRAGHTPIYSTTLGRWSDGAEFDAAYWAANLRRPVLFYPAVSALLADGYATYVEASPHPLLLQAIDDTASETNAAVLTVPTLRRDLPEQEQLLANVARLYEHGFAFDWDAIYRGGRLVDVPSYAWQRNRFWVADAEHTSSAATLGTHPLLGATFTSANGERVWSSVLDADALLWLKDHAVRGSVLLPASAYVEMALAVAEELRADRPSALENLTIKEAIVLHGRPSLQIVVTPKAPGRETIRYFVREQGSQEWVLAASGMLVDRGAVADPSHAPDPAAFERAAAAPTRTGEEHAAYLAARGYEFGATFRCIDWYAIEGDTIVAAAHLPEKTNVTSYGLHPALLDAGFQALAALLLPASDANDQLLPTKIEGARFSGLPGTSAVLISATITDAALLMGDVRIYASDGALLAAVDGLRFRAVHFDAERADDELLYRSEWIAQERDAMTSAPRERYLVLADAGGVATQIAAALERKQLNVAIVSPQALASEAIAGCAVVDLRGLDLRDAAIGEIAAHGASVAAAASALDEHATGARLWLVTRGACAVAVGEGAAVAPASLWGLGAVIANERPDLRCALVDLAELDTTAVLELVAEIIADGAESRVALRGGRRSVMRVTVPAAETTQRAHRTRALRADEKAVLRVGTLGMLETITFEPSARTAPGAGEVEIAVEAAGLNFLDVMAAMGLYPSPAAKLTLGGECAGTIVRVGEGVTEFAPGDEVVAVSPEFNRSGTMATHLLVPAVLAAKKPRALSFAQGAALPCVYLTCYYALVEIARMRAGESLLVHSATGGVGLSAINVARWLDLVVFATAGTDEKRAYLRALGVEHVMDSRSSGFAETIRAATGGRGVDAILNSLAGAAIPEGLSALAPYGRFLEIGKRDMWDDSRIGLGAFLHNRSFSGVDLATLVVDRRELVGSMLRTLMEMVDTGVLAPLPTTAFPAARASEAFHMMAQAKHIGKIVIELRASAISVPDDAPAVRGDATYLITGGAGALGIVAAQALVDAGAKHVVLSSRRGPSPDAAASIEALRARGADVELRNVDISSEPDVEQLLRELRATKPPLRGVIHSAGVLDDGLIEDLTPGHFERVMAGKAQGALVLDRLTRRDPIDVFVLFSSVASMLGSPGQGNYAAANAMLDALAERRASEGLPAVSIAWGPWSDVGLAAAQENRGARVGAQGLISISPDEGRELFARLLDGGLTRVAAMRFDAQRWGEAVAGGERARLFDRLPQPGEAARTRSSGLAAIRAASPDQAPAELHRVVVDQLAAVLRLKPEQIGGAKAFRSLGLDSLMGLELRNRLERSLEVKLAASTIWNYPTADQLCAYLMDHLEIARVATPGRPANGATHSTHSTPASIDDLDNELAEAEALLASL